MAQGPASEFRQIAQQEDAWKKVLKKQVQLPANAREQLRTAQEGRVFDVFQELLGDEGQRIVAQLRKGGVPMREILQELLPAETQDPIEKALDLPLERELSFGAQRFDQRRNIIRCAAAAAVLAAVGGGTFGSLLAKEAEAGPTRQAELRCDYMRNQFDIFGFSRARNGSIVLKDGEPIVTIARADADTGLNAGKAPVKPSRSWLKTMPSKQVYLPATRLMPDEELSQWAVRKDIVTDSSSVKTVADLDKLPQLDFNLTFNRENLCFVANRRDARTVRSRDGEPIHSSMGVFAGFSTGKASERSLVELAGFQREFRVRAGEASLKTSPIVHAILTQFSSPDLPEVKDGKPFFDCFEVLNLHLLGFRKVNGNYIWDSTYVDSSKHQRSRAYTTTMAASLREYCERKGEEVPKLVEGTGVTEERYMVREIHDKELTSVMMRYDVPIWFFVEDTPEGPKPTMKVGLIDYESSKEVLAKSRPHLFDQKGLFKGTFAKPRVFEERKEPLNIDKPPWFSSCLAQNSRAEDLPVFFPFKLDPKTGDVTLDPLAIYDKKKKPITSSSFKPELDDPKDERESGPYKVFFGGESGTPSSLLYDLSMNKDGRLVLDGGVFIAGQGEVVFKQEEVDAAFKGLIAEHKNSQLVLDALSRLGTMIRATRLEAPAPQKGGCPLPTGLVGDDVDYKPSVLAVVDGDKSSKRRRK